MYSTVAHRIIIVNEGSAFCVSICSCFPVVYDLVCLVMDLVIYISWVQCPQGILGTKWDLSP